jgi:hypothetical protein
MPRIWLSGGAGWGYGCAVLAEMKSVDILTAMRASVEHSLRITNIVVGWLGWFIPTARFRSSDRASKVGGEWAKIYLPPPLFISND